MIVRVVMPMAGVLVRMVVAVSMGMVMIVGMIMIMIMIMVLAMIVGVVGMIVEGMLRKRVRRLGLQELRWGHLLLDRIGL